MVASKLLITTSILDTLHKHMKYLFNISHGYKFKVSTLAFQIH